MVNFYFDLVKTFISFSSVAYNTFLYEYIKLDASDTQISHLELIFALGIVNDKIKKSNN